MLFLRPTRGHGGPNKVKQELVIRLLRRYFSIIICLCIRDTTIQYEETTTLIKVKR